MCNAHFQHLFDDTNLSSPSYSATDLQQQQQQQQQQNSRMQSQLPLHPHDSSAATAPGQDGPVSSLSPVSTSTSNWSYSMDAQSDVQMYSPASVTSYSSFHSPIDTTTRAYALAGALQQQQQQQQQDQHQQQQQQTGAGYPESSQRSTELARGVRGHIQGHEHGHGPTPSQTQYYTEAQQAVQRWGYAAHAHDMSFPPQEALSVSRAPIMDAQAQTPSTSGGSPTRPDSHPTGQGHTHMPQPQPPVYAAGNMSAGGAVQLPVPPAGPDAAADQRSRHMQQAAPLNERAFLHLQQNHHQHRAMSSQPQHAHLQWHPHLQPQQTSSVPYLQAPTPRTINASQHGTLRTFLPYAGGGGNHQHDYENESDEFGDHEEFDDGLDEEEGSGRGHFHMSIPPNGSPTPELQFPQGVSGTPSDLFRANFMLYGMDPANWPVDGAGGFPGGNNMSSLVTNSAAGGTGGSGPSGSPMVSREAGAGGKGRAVDPSMAPPGFFRSPEKREKGKRTQGSGAEESEGQTVKVLIESTTPGEPPKKVKMHQCRICQKLFPRPSGLATHMNSHSGARPFKCPLALCPKTFAVRSNARRHLRTHGISVPPNALNKNGQGRNQEEPFQVGFETPVVVDVQDPSAGEFIGGEGSAGAGSTGRPPKLRWVPPSLATRTNVQRLRSLSPSSDMADLDPRGDSASLVNGEVEMGARIGMGVDGNRGFNSPSRAESAASIYTRRAPGLRIAPAPLPPAVPSTNEGAAADLTARFDERNSYAEAGTFPYHPDQWRCLPGPGLVLPLRS